MYDKALLKEAILASPEKGQLQLSPCGYNQSATFLVTEGGIGFAPTKGTINPKTSSARNKFAASVLKEANHFGTFLIDQKDGVISWAKV